MISGLVLKQPHIAVTLISSWGIWGNWGADSKGLAEDTHVVNSGAWLAFQDWSCCGVFADRINLIWGPSVHSKASGIQTGKLEAWEVRGPDKWVLTLGGLWEPNKTYGLRPPKYLSSSPLSLSLSYPLTQGYTYPQKLIPRQEFHGSLQARLCFQLLSSWTNAESMVPYRECSPFLSLGHSDAKEKATLLSAHFVHKGAPIGPGLTLGCPTCTEATRPIWLTQVVFFRGADVLKFIASQMEPKLLSQLGLDAWVPAKTQPSLNSSLWI